MGIFVIFGVMSKVLKDLLFLDMNETFKASFFISHISLASPNDILAKCIKAGGVITNRVLML